MDDKELNNFSFKRFCLKLLNTNTYFIILYTVAVLADGIYDLHIDTNAILMGYGMIVSKNIINYGIDSTINSKSGEMPTRPSRIVSNNKEEK